MINGAQVNDFLSLGIGVEATSYVYEGDQNYRTTIYPVFLDARFYIPKKMVQPMFSFQFGYSFIGDTNNTYASSYSSDFVPHDGGIFMGVNAGMRIFISQRFSIVADGGISLQKLQGQSTYNYSGPYIEVVPSLKLNVGVCVSLGSIKE
jgi:hypothetical protein